MFLEGGRELLLTALDGLTTVTRPSNEFFQEGSNALDKSEASFKRLQKDPDTSTKSSNGPCDEDKESEPQDCENGILIAESHGVCC
mmetsp:Transcript_3595/g.5263  ORF Transcript_3595/g.5263 Transcript_3595/m.5263 type:complete len:86 (-) Transcript_3595:85-342(-)